MSELAEQAWRLHRESADQPWIVTPSAPVLFFGDLSAYQASPLRIATVALNPSRREFPAKSPFSRFPGAESGDIAAYIESLQNYFRVAPYSDWFDFYERALSGLDASYYGKKRNAVLHTDIASVLPTDPTWSKLDQQVREDITASGIELWHRLIAFLEPQIVLWSTAKLWLNSIRLEPITTWSDLWVCHETQGGAPRKRPIVVQGRNYRHQNGRRLVIAFIPAAQKPLARLSHAQKAQAGKIILDFWRISDVKT